MLVTCMHGASKIRPYPVPLSKIFWSLCSYADALCLARGRRPDFGHHSVQLVFIQ